MTAAKPCVLCLASYFKGNRFLIRARQEGWHVVLLTLESLLGEAWPRERIDEVFALPTFQDREALLKSVSYLARSREICRVIALDDFDVEVAAGVREHFRLPGMNESAARLFRDKLAMRTRARELGVSIPEFTGLFNHDAVREFLGRVAPPWLIKPRSQASAAGIRKIHHADDAWREIDKLGDEQSHFVLERFVSGDLYHVDSLVRDGAVVFVEANGYVRPLLDVYQGGGVYATRTLPRDRPEIAELRAINERVLTGFGLGQGASHTEFLKAHADGQMYFIETSARVGGANTAEMVETATGINLWEEWARIELGCGNEYALPAAKNHYGGVILSLARQEWPDNSSFTDPEIVFRLNMKQHIGFVLGSESPTRIEQLLAEYAKRIARDFMAVAPPAERVSH